MEGWARISLETHDPRGGSWIQGGGLVAHVARAVAWSVDGDPVTAAGAGVASPPPESRRGDWCGSVAGRSDAVSL